MIFYDFFCFDEQFYAGLEERLQLWFGGENDAWADIIGEDCEQYDFSEVFFFEGFEEGFFEELVALDSGGDGESDVVFDEEIPHEVGIFGRL